VTTIVDPVAAIVALRTMSPVAAWMLTLENVTFEIALSGSPIIWPAEHGVVAPRAP
jgi:hypothetical protein